MPIQQTKDSARLVVDIISDLVCPWCYVGRHHLGQAIHQWQESAPGNSVQIAWHPFQLDPDVPDEGIDRDEYRQQKFGGNGSERMEQIEQNDRQATLAASQSGLPANLAGITRQSNTVRAHALVSMAQGASQDKLVTGLFKAYFVDGADLCDDGTLIEIGRASGLAEPVIESALADDSVQDTIRRADAQAREMGIKSVPMFILNQSLAVSGAATPETLLAAVEKALSGKPSEPDTAD